jgi:hypothetical protein
MIINSSTNVLTTGYCQPRMVIDSAGILFVSNGAYPQSSLFSFDPDLRQRWEVTIGNMNTGGPAIGKNGTLVIAGNGTDVRAYRGNSYGQPGPPVQISRDVTNLVITFSGILEAANQINGPWTNVPGAVSPLKVSVDRAQQFYRSRQE